MSTPQSSAGPSRRPAARKKVNDDAAYFSASAGAKRQAGERAEGEPRMKRKRVAESVMPVVRNLQPDADGRITTVDFKKLSNAEIFRYLTHFEIAPPVFPSPMLADDPPPPFSLDKPPRHMSRGPSPTPSITPANRPRRDPKDQSRRRSSRLQEEESPSRAPILADKEEFHGVLCAIADRHFREMAAINGREEVDALVAFMCAVEKYKNAKNGTIVCKV